MKWLKATFRPECVVCGDPAPIGADRCPRHLRTMEPVAPVTPPGFCVECGVQVPPGTNQCPDHYDPNRPSPPPPTAQPATREAPASDMPEPARPRFAAPRTTPEVQISFGNAMKLGAGFTMGAFLMMIPLIILFIVIGVPFLTVLFEEITGG